VAARQYEQVIGLAKSNSQPFRRAQAHCGLSACQQQVGKFRQAIRHHDTALALLDESAGEEEEEQWLRMTLLMNRGLVRLYQAADQNGDREAIELLKSAVATAEAARDRILTAQCLDVLALALLKTGDWHRAVEFANRASDVAIRSGGAELTRQACSTLALIQLVRRDMDSALAAANAAAEFGSIRSRDAYPLAVQGTALLRCDDAPRARQAFLAAHDNAIQLLGKDSGAYEVLEADGLALTGLVLCGDDPGRLRDAEKAYRLARQRTRAPGAMKLCTLKLDELLAADDASRYDSLRACAHGDIP
jgi:tetratricopeptide (TPR) repeat protein